MTIWQRLETTKTKNLIVRTRANLLVGISFSCVKARNPGGVFALYFGGESWSGSQGCGVGLGCGC